MGVKKVKFWEKLIELKYLLRLMQAHYFKAFIPQKKKLPSFVSLKIILKFSENHVRRIGVLQ